MNDKKPILVYVKTKNSNKFQALSSLKNFTFAPSLMYACLIPFEKLETLKEWADSFKELCVKNSVKIELRHYKGQAIHKVG